MSKMNSCSLVDFGRVPMKSITTLLIRTTMICRGMGGLWSSMLALRTALVIVFNLRFHTGPMEPVTELQKSVMGGQVAPKRVGVCEMYHIINL